MNLEKRIENIVTAHTISGVYSGPNNIKFEVDCLMELDEALPTYIQINIDRKKILNPDQYDPDFMVFLNKVDTNSDGEYVVIYHVDSNLRFGPM